MGDAERLRELHDSYAWEVNAAVGEGRLDLVRRLADDYFDEALALISLGDGPVCSKPQCVVCQRPPTEAVVREPRRGLLHLIRRRKAR